MSERRCTKCGELKLFVFFQTSQARVSLRNPCGYNSHCKKCAQNAITKWAKENPEKKRRTELKWRKEHPGERREIEWKCYLKRKYGLSLEQWKELLALSEGRCAICGTKPRRLCLDHNHRTGKVRGILCDECNRGIGLLKDDSDIVFEAAKYLKKHE